MWFQRPLAWRRVNSHLWQPVGRRSTRVSARRRKLESHSTRERLSVHGSLPSVARLRHCYQVQLHTAVYTILRLTMTWQSLHSCLRQLFWPPWCGARKCKHFQHMQSDCRSGVSNKLFLNGPIQFHLKNVTDLYQLTLQSTTSCPTTWRSYCVHRFRDVILPYLFLYRPL